LKMVAVFAVNRFFADFNGSVGGADRKEVRRQTLV